MLENGLISGRGSCLRSRTSVRRLPDAVGILRSKRPECSRHETRGPRRYPAHGSMRSPDRTGCGSSSRVHGFGGRGGGTPTSPSGLGRTISETQCRTRTSSRSLPRRPRARLRPTGRMLATLSLAQSALAPMHQEVDRLQSRAGAGRVLIISGVGKSRSATGMDLKAVLDNNRLALELLDIACRMDAQDPPAAMVVVCQRQQLPRSAAGGLACVVRPRDHARRLKDGLPRG